MKRLLTGIALGLFFLVPAAFAQQDAVSDFLSCDPLVIPSERLACFDSILKQYKLKYGLLDSTPQNLAKESLSRPRAVPQGSVNAERLGDVQSPKKTTTANNGENAQSVIQAITTSYLGHRTFYLGDGSQWQETSGSSLPEGDYEKRTVRLERNFLGGWKLYIDGITGFARVKKIS